MDEMPERDQGVGLSPAVGKLQLADGLVVLAGEAQHDVPDQAPEVEGGKREGEKVYRILVNLPFSPLHHDIVEIGRKQMQRQIARAEIVAELHHFMPGLPGELSHGFHLLFTLFQP